MTETRRISLHYSIFLNVKVQNIFHKTRSFKDENIMHPNPAECRYADCPTWYTRKDGPEKIKRFSNYILFFVLLLHFTSMELSVSDSALDLLTLLTRYIQVLLVIFLDALPACRKLRNTT